MGRTTEAVRTMLATMIHFDYDKSNIRAEDAAVLDQKVAILQANPNLRIRISGHCDERGSDEYNLALGNRRATSAKQYVVSHGIDAGRIETVSYGEERPIAQGHDETAWAQNRRDEFEILSGGDARRRARRRGPGGADRLRAQAARRRAAGGRGPAGLSRPVPRRRPHRPGRRAAAARHGAGADGPEPAAPLGAPRGAAGSGPSARPTVGHERRPGAGRSVREPGRSRSGAHVRSLPPAVPPWQPRHGQARVP